MTIKRSNIDFTQLGIRGENLGNGNHIFNDAVNGNVLRFKTLVASGGTRVITNGNEIIISGATIGAGNGDITNGANRGTGTGIFGQKSGTTLTFKSISSLTPNTIKITNNSNNIFLSGNTAIGLPAGVNREIQFNKNNIFGNDGNFLYNYTGNSLTIATGSTGSYGRNNLINRSNVNGCFNIGFGTNSITGNNNIVNTSSSPGVNGNNNLILGVPSLIACNSSGNIMNSVASTICCTNYSVSIGLSNSLGNQNRSFILGNANSISAVSPRLNNFINGSGNCIINCSFGTIFGVSNIIRDGFSDGIYDSQCSTIRNSYFNTITSSSSVISSGNTANYVHLTALENFCSNSLPSTYSCHLMTGNLAIVCTPLSGSTVNDYILSWNPTDRKVKRLSFSNISASPAGSNMEIQFNNNGVLGAHNKFRYNQSYSNLIIGNSSNNPTDTCCSLIIGGASDVCLCNSELNLSIGNSLKIERSFYGFVMGVTNTICNLSTTYSTHDFIFGANNIFCHSVTADLNHAYRSVLGGYNNMIGCISYGSIINSCNSCLCYSKLRTIINSSNTTLFDNTPAAQGSHITAISLNNFALNSLSSYNYACHLITGNLAIACTPLSGSTSDTVLVWNNNDKKVKQVSQNSLSSSGSTLIKKASVTLTPTQIMNGTWVQILPSPGVGKINNPITYIATLNWVDGNITYSDANEFLIGFSPDSIDQIATLAPDADFLRRNYRSISQGSFYFLPVEISDNLPLYVGNITAMGVTGNSSLTITILYIISDI